MSLNRAHERRKRLAGPTERERSQIVEELLRMQKLPDPPFDGVWYDGMILRVRGDMWETPRILRWTEAQKLIAASRKTSLPQNLNP